MRKVFLFFVPLLALLSSCSYDDSEIKDRLDDLDNKVTELEKQVKALNTDVLALKDLVSGKRFISDVKANDDGSYTITMVTAEGEQSTITIKDGQDGQSPALGVKKDTDGVYYWTLNGEWMLVDGKKLPASGTNGVTPQFKIDKNDWYVSYDNGNTWTNCGKASYDTNIFKSVTLTEDGKQAIVILADGTELVLDLYTGFGITFGMDASQTLRVGETMEIPFTLTGADGNTQIELLPSAEWKAVAERNGDKGVIKVSAPSSSQTGKVIVLVNDGGYKTLMRTLTFVAGILNVTTSSTQMPMGGGTVTAEVETDLEFSVSIPAGVDWVTLPDTRAQLHRETVTLTVAANTDPVARQARIDLVSGGTVIETILIFQVPYSDLSIMILSVEAEASRANTIYIPVYGVVDATIDWGDGNKQEVRETISGAAAMINHVYAQPGVYSVSVKGSVEEFNGNLVKAANKPGIVEVVQWGKLGLKSLANAFSGDTKLVRVAVPEEGAFAAVESANNMFYNCSSLTEVPETLLSGAPGLTTVASMFYGAGKLESIPVQFLSGLTKLTSASGLFTNCKKIESIPAGFFHANTAITDLSSVFKGSGIKAVPEGLFDGLTELTSLSSAFAECAALQSLPADLFKNQTAVTSIAMLFKGCSSLKTIPESMFDSFGEVANMASLFSGCQSLDNLPAELFKNMAKATTGNYLFEGCKKMTTFPTLKNCSSLKTVNAIWKDCTALVTAPSDFFPESVKDGFTLAYMFQGCTALKNVPGDLFDNFTGEGIIISDMFNGCTALESLPVGIFDKVKNIKTAATAFSGCTAFTGESPYTTITVAGAPVKVHLYERVDYPEHFPTAVTSFKDCFKGCTKIADYADIPIAWGGVSDGTKAKPTLTLTVAPKEGEEYFTVIGNIKGTEVKSGKFVIGTQELIDDAFKELGAYDKICNRYGINLDVSKVNSADGMPMVGNNAQPDKDYVLLVAATNAHGTTIAQVKCRTATVPKGEANFERYLGNWTVTSTSSEINKAPHTYNIRIVPYRTNESFRVYGWGITTVGEADAYDCPFIMNYKDGAVSVPTNNNQGMVSLYYAYLCCRFYKPETSSYWVYTPSEPLITGTYDATKNQITLTGSEFTEKASGNKYTVSGWDYFLYSSGSYYEHADLFKSDYTVSDYSVGPYTLVKSASSSTAEPNDGLIVTIGDTPAKSVSRVPTGAAQVHRK